MSQPETELRQQPITIVLVDDHTMMREGTRRLLEEDPDLKVIGEAQDGAEALPLCRSLKPQVIVLDIAMKNINGFGVAQALLRESERAGIPGILVLTAYDQLAYVQAMLRLGVKGYWLKSARGSEIRQAVHEVAAGKRSLAPEVRRLLLDNESNPITSPEPLTARELEVLRLVVQGAQQRNRPAFVYLRQDRRDPPDQHLQQAGRSIARRSHRAGAKTKAAPHGGVKA